MVQRLPVICISSHPWRTVKHYQNRRAIVGCRMKHDNGQPRVQPVYLPARGYRFLIRDKLHQIHAWSQEHFGVRPLEESVPALEQWWEGPVGQALLCEEHTFIDRNLRHLYGFHLMQLAVSRKFDLTTASTINHRFSLSPVPISSNGGANGLCTGQADLE